MMGTEAAVSLDHLAGESGLRDWHTLQGACVLQWPASATCIALQVRLTGSPERGNIAALKFQGAAAMAESFMNTVITVEYHFCGYRLELQSLSKGWSCHIHATFKQLLQLIA